MGTSIDGPAEYHDEARVDFRGRGTYERAVAGLSLLRAAYDLGRLPSLGVLTVIDPTRSAARIYRHIVHELGVRSIDFLLPDLTHDSFVPAEGRRPEDYGAFLCDAFDAWAEDGDPNIQVRVLNSAMSLLLGGRSWVSGFGPDVAPAITVASDGSVGPDDLLWVEFGRLTGWSRSVTQRPKYWGKLVTELVYEYLDRDVAEWLKVNVPQPQKGRTYHQHLSGQYGLRKLTEHIWKLIGIAKTCESMTELRDRMAELHGLRPIQLRLYVPYAETAPKRPLTSESLRLFWQSPTSEPD